MATGRWGVIKYDPAGGGVGTPACTQIRTGSFDAGVFNATVEITAPSFAASAEQTFCKTSLKDANGVSITQPAGDQYVFFYARGTATGGTLVLHSTPLGAAGDITLQVFPLTGRVQRI
jgi:hypothetical protein